MKTKRLIQMSISFARNNSATWPLGCLQARKRLWDKPLGVSAKPGADLRVGARLVYRRPSLCEPAEGASGGGEVALLSEALDEGMHCGRMRPLRPTSAR